MTSYSVERPVRRPAASRVRPGLAHLRAGQVTTGQPVTIRTVDTDGREIEFPAVYVRTDGLHLRCAPEDGGATRRYRPSQVFPRRVVFRRWVVTLKYRDVAPDEDGSELLPVFVNARTELEARYEALKQVRAKHGDRANWRFTLHSVRREG
jgi:transposase